MKHLQAPTSTAMIVGRVLVDAGRRLTLPGRRRRVQVRGRGRPRRRRPWPRLRVLAAVLEARVERPALAVLKHEPLTPLVAHGRPLTAVLRRRVLSRRLRMCVILRVMLSCSGRRGGRRGGSDLCIVVVL